MWFQTEQGLMGRTGSSSLGKTFHEIWPQSQEVCPSSFIVTFNLVYTLKDEDFEIQKKYQVTSIQVSTVYLVLCGLWRQNNLSQNFIPAGEVGQRETYINDQQVTRLLCVYFLQVDPSSLVEAQKVTRVTDPMVVKAVSYGWAEETLL